MSRTIRSNQKGAGLLIFTYVVAIVSFSLIVGYSALLTKSAANDLHLRQKAYLVEVRDRLEALWNVKALDIDKADSTYTAESVLEEAGIILRWGGKVSLTPLITPAAGPPFRAIAVYLPAIAEEDNPPDLGAFASSGYFVPCTTPEANKGCPAREFVMFHSRFVHEKFGIIAEKRVTEIAKKAQVYIKARRMEDPERNVGINYFYNPGQCTPVRQGLGCHPVYAPLATKDASGVITLTPMAVGLGLGPSEVFTPWGTPIEASNVEDSEYLAPPFSMAFRYTRPDGTFVKKIAYQQI